MGLWSPEAAHIYVETFRATWGGLEEASLRRALHEGTDHARLFAVRALGATRAQEARAELLPLLASERPLEHWASARELGKLREERGLPAPGHLLTEFLPPAPVDRASEYYRAWRTEVPFLLGAWGRPESVPPLRAGLQAALRVELTLDPADGASGSDLYSWSLYEDALVYALGRLGGFGALAGIAGAETPSHRYPGIEGVGRPQTHLGQWRVQLVVG